MKKKNKLIILCSVVVFLIAATFAVGRIFRSDESTDDTVDETEYEYVGMFRENNADTSVETDRVADYISYEYRNETVKLKRLDNGVWTVYDCLDFPLVQEYPSEMVDCLKKLRVIARISGEKADLSAYGLEDSEKFVTVGLTNGEKIIYKFGGGNSSRGGYYLKVSTEDDILLVAEGYSVFEKGVFDMASVENTPYISSYSLRKIDISYGENNGTFIREKVVEERETDETDEDGEKVIETRISLNNYYSLNGGETKPVSNAKFDTVFNFIGTLKLEKCVKFAPTEEELKNYGLDADSVYKLRIYYVTDTEDELSEFSFSFGISGENAYAAVGGEMIYTVSRLDAENAVRVIDDGFSPDENGTEEPGPDDENEETETEDENNE